MLSGGLRRFAGVTLPAGGVSPFTSRMEADKRTRCRYLSISLLIYSNDRREHRNLRSQGHNTEDRYSVYNKIANGLRACLGGLGG